MFLRELCRLCRHFLGAEEEGKSAAVCLGQCAVAVLLPDSGEPSVKSKSQLTGVSASSRFRPTPLTASVGCLVLSRSHSTEAPLESYRMGR